MSNQIETVWGPVKFDQLVAGSQADELWRENCRLTKALKEALDREKQLQQGLMDISRFCSSVIRACTVKDV